MTLYEIEQQITECVDLETGEVINIEKLDALEMAREEKIENICLYIKNLKAEAKAIKEEKDNLSERQKVAENKVKSLTTYITSYLNGEKFKTAKVNVSYRKSESVEILDIEQIPEDYLKYSEPTADKMLIKQSLKKGINVPGVELVESNNIQIK